MVKPIQQPACRRHFLHYTGISTPGRQAPAGWATRATVASSASGSIGLGRRAKDENSSTIRPSIRYAYRGPADPLGTMGNETSVQVGPGSQTGNLTRWGDYSTISVDPVDGCTFVFTTEFIPANGSFNWSTFIHSFKLSTCN